MSLGGDINPKIHKPGTAALNGAQTFTGGQRVGITALTSSGASVASNFAANNDFSLTMTENTTLAAPSNVVAGQSGCIFITQGAGSAFTLAYNSVFKFGTGTVPTLTATLSAQDTLYYNVRDTTHIECNLVKGNA